MLPEDKRRGKTTPKMNKELDNEEEFIVLKLKAICERSNVEDYIDLYNKISTCKSLDYVRVIERTKKIEVNWKKFPITESSMAKLLDAYGNRDIKFSVLYNTIAKFACELVGRGLLWLYQVYPEILEVHDGDPRKFSFLFDDVITEPCICTGETALYRCGLIYETPSVVHLLTDRKELDGCRNAMFEYYYSPDAKNFKGTKESATMVSTPTLERALLESMRVCHTDGLDKAFERYLSGDIGMSKE